MMDKENVSDEIVDAARIVIGKYGYRKTTMDDIAALANRGKTSIYYYFKNKEDIFFKVIQKEAFVLMEQLKEEIGKFTEAIDKLKAYMFARVQLMKGISAFYNVLKPELTVHLEFIEKAREQYTVEEITMVRNILDEGKKSNVFVNIDPHDTAITIVSALKGLEIPVFATNEENNQIQFEELINLLIYGIIK